MIVRSGNMRSRNLLLFSFPAALLLLLTLVTNFTGLASLSTRGRQNLIFEKLLEVDHEEKFLWYAPHSGFGNQLIGFRHALRVAGLLNRTLIVPPILRHFDVWLGRCERGKVQHADVLRRSSWISIMRLLKSGNYVSMADVVDISRIPTNLVRTLDLRLFLATRCGIDISRSIVNCSWCGALQGQLASAPPPDWPPNVLGLKDPLTRCAHMLGSLGRARKLPGQRRPMAAQVRRPCTETVWVYTKNSSGDLVSKLREPSFQNGAPPKCPGFSPGLPPQFERSYIWNGLNVTRTLHLPLPTPINVVSQLAPKHTVPGEARVLTLGSTMHYFDLEAPLGEERANRIACETAFLPFTRPIMKAGQRFADEVLGGSYACLHFRGGDGVFSDIHMRNKSMFSFIDKLTAIRSRVLAGESDDSNLKLFLMSDLHTHRWRRRMRRMFGSPGYDVTLGKELEGLDSQFSQDILARRYGIFTNRISHREARSLLAINKPMIPPKGFRNQSNLGRELTAMGIYLEQAVCSCATLDFLDHPESTISENIFHLRAGGLCGLDYDE